MKITPVQIADSSIGPGHPCFIIAEADVNHNGDIELAKNLVDVAVQAKADTVKFQNFKAEELASAFAPKAAYQEETTDRCESQLDMLRKLEMDLSSHRQLMKYCDDRGILFLFSPFEKKRADELEQLEVEAYKIPSGENTNLPFLSCVARNGKPMIVSIGMSTLLKVEQAVRAIENTGNRKLIDEPIRHSMTKMSHLHFVSTSEYVNRVVPMGEKPWRVTVTGAPSLDNLKEFSLLSRNELEGIVGIPMTPSPLELNMFLVNYFEHK